MPQKHKPKYEREYVSKHVYKTPKGLYYNDRTSKRLTARRGKAIEKNAPEQRKRMAARFRDERGKLIFRKVKGSSDVRNKDAKGKHTGSPGEEEFEGESVYDSLINSTYAEKYVEKRLNEEDTEFWHFNLHDIETLEE